MRVAGIVLAAGASTRFGSAKQLAELNGERLLERSIRVAKEAGLQPILVVLGARAAEIQATCSLGDATVHWNAEWPEGMGASIRKGVAAVAQDCDGLILLTCDQPTADSSHLRQLVESGSTSEAVGSRYADRVGVPAFFPAALFGSLMQLRGDQGARHLLRRAIAIDLPDGELDVDTGEMLEVVRLRLAQQS